MEARMVTLTPKPTDIDELAAFWTDAVVAEITAQPGNRGFVLLKDTANARVIGLSLWDSTADAEASGPTFRRHMEAVGEYLADPPHAVIAAVAAPAAGALTG